MGNTSTGPQPAPPAEHVYAAATWTPLTPQQAQHGVRRGSVWLRESTRVDIVEVICQNCRRPWAEVVDEPCAAITVGTEHLRGGPQGERKKRKNAAHECSGAHCQHEAFREPAAASS